VFIDEKGEIRSSSLAMYKSLGDKGLQGLISPEPDYDSIKLVTQDTHVIIASDGFWDAVKAGEGKIDDWVTDIINQLDEPQAISESLLASLKYIGGIIKEKKPGISA